MRAVGIFLVAVVMMLVRPAVAGAAERLNVLFIAVDDLRPQLGCYGDRVVRSPNIDALAGRSVLFRHAYCQLALCNPSRASLLAGRRPESMGVWDLKTFVRDAAPDVVTLPELFKMSGYVSLSYGKIFHAGNGNHDDPKSFTEKPWKPGRAKAELARVAKTNPESDDVHADEPPYAAPECGDSDLQDGMIADAAIEALRKNKDRPFFIGVGFLKPHLPFVAPKKYWDLYEREAIKLPENRGLPTGAPAFASNDASEIRRYAGVPQKGELSDDLARTLIHGYLASVSYMDAQVGRVMAELDRLGLAERTVVVLWGDHGYHLGEQGTWNKRTNWEIATRVPLLVSAPGMKRAVESEALVELVDVYPTLVELCGVEGPGKLEGKSFAGVLRDEKAAGKRVAVSVYKKNVKEMGGEVVGRGVTDGRYRLVEWKAEKGGKVVYELYDHERDPGETVNVAGENREVVERLVGEVR